MASQPNCRENPCVHSPACPSQWVNSGVDHAEVEVRKIVVASAAQAEQLRLESSPTIRINGRDIALDRRESNCGDCGDICGCEGQVDCWVWQGMEHVEAPKALIIDAILRAYGQAWEPPPAPSKRFHLPENLRKFFAANAQCDGLAHLWWTGV